MPVTPHAVEGHRSPGRATHHQARLVTRTYETVVNLIASTSNRGGLVVRARLDKRKYPTGKKVSAKEFAAINLKPHRWRGDWNYAISPRKTS